MSGNSYDEMSDTDQVSKMQESSEGKTIVHHTVVAYTVVNKVIVTNEMMATRLEITSLSGLFSGRDYLHKECVNPC